MRLRFAPLLALAGLTLALAAAPTHADPPVLLQPVAPAAEAPKANEPAKGPLADAAKRLLLKSVRKRALDRAVSEGITVPGGGSLKLKKDEAAAALAELEDDLILTHVAEKYGEKVYAGKLEDFARWIWEHRDEIVKWVLSILALFAIDHETVEPGSWLWWTLLDAAVRAGGFLTLSP